MSQTSSLPGGLTRRSFLKTSGLIAGAAALGSSAFPIQSLAQVDSQDDSSEEQIFSAVCRGACNGGCLLRAHVRNGVVAKVSPGVLPDERYRNRCCLKGLSHAQEIYNPNRIKYPMKRVGERGSGEWERISWEEAIKTITDTWKKEIEENGTEALAFALGAGNCGSVGGNTNFILPHALGAYGFSSGSDEALMKAGTRTTSGVEMAGSEQQKAVASIQNSKCIILWGANVTNSGIQTWKHIAIAKEKGAKLIVIDTNFTGAAAKADMYVRIRPATDAALMVGMMKIIFDNNLHDEEFIRKSTVGPLLVKASNGEYLRMSDLGVAPTEGPPDMYGMPTVVDPLAVWDEEVKDFVEISSAVKPAIYGSYDHNGEKLTTALELLIKRADEYPIEKVAEICDIPQDTILELVDVYCGNGPSRIIAGFGLDHYTNGHYSCMSAFTLSAITGNFSKPGAGIGGSPVSPNDYGNGNLQYAHGFMTGGYQVLRLPEMIECGYQDLKSKTKPLKLKSIFNMMTNWIGGTLGYTSSVEKILDYVELHVTVDLVMCDSAQWSDIVLPAAHYFEQDDCGCANMMTPFLMLQEKAIEPLYEAKSDYEIAKALLLAMGVDIFFKDMDQLDYVKLFLESEAGAAKGISYETLKKEKAIAVIDPGGEWPPDGQFPTETGRFQWYFEKPVPSTAFEADFDYKKEQLPILFEAPEIALNEDAGDFKQSEESKKYPYVVIQPHMRWRTHATWAFNAWLRELDPEPCVYINNQDALEKGIEEGDLVKAFNDHGSVVLRAHINPGVRPKALMLPKGWHRGQYVEGHYQSLTSKITNPFIYNAAYFEVLVDLEKYQ